MQLFGDIVARTLCFSFPVFISLQKNTRGLVRGIALLYWN